MKRTTIIIKGEDMKGLNKMIASCLADEIDFIEKCLREAPTDYGDRKELFDRKVVTN